MTTRRRTARTKAHEAAAYREAGHAVMAWNLDVLLMPVSIFPNGPGAGKNAWNGALRNVDLDWIRSTPSTRLAERLAEIVLAGPVAQRVFAAGAPRGTVYGKRISEARALLRAASERRNGNRPLYGDVGRALERFFRRADVRQAVAALAGELLVEGTLSGASVTRRIEAWIKRPLPLGNPRR